MKRESPARRSGYKLSHSHMNLLKSKNVNVIEMIPPALNTDLGGKGLRDAASPVAAFIESVFQQLQEGKNELTFGFSDEIIKAGPQDLKNAFNRMNPDQNS
jgi:uncharacterized oxidoreductase